MPRPGPPADSRPGPRIGTGTRRPRQALGLALVIAAGSLAGCTSVVSPLGQWRAAYDGNLFRKLSPEEMADASGTVRLQQPLPAMADAPGHHLAAAGRRATARPTSSAPTAGGPSPSPPRPRRRGRVPGRAQALPAGEVRGGREAVRQDRQGPQGDHLGRERPVLPGRVPVPAQALRRGPRQLREALPPTTPPPTTWRSSPSASTRSAALAVADRPQGACREEAPLQAHGSTAGCRSSTPRARASRRSNTSSTTTRSATDGRQGRHRDRRLLHEARRLRDRRGAITSHSSANTAGRKTPVPPVCPARPPSTPG